jgi:hypothetical protein
MYKLIIITLIRITNKTVLKEMITNHTDVHVSFVAKAQLTEPLLLEDET